MFYLKKILYEFFGPYGATILLILYVTGAVIKVATGSVAWMFFFQFVAVGWLTFVAPQYEDRVQ